jgi:hypothetical protein
MISRRKLLLSVFAVIVTGTATACFRLPPPDLLPNCLNTVLVAFQTAHTPQEASLVWRVLDDHQSNLAKAQYADFAFIVAYTVLFLLLAGIGRRRPIPSSKIAGRLIIIFALVTAIADIGENCFTLANIAALEHGLPTDALVSHMRDCSLTKWAASGVTLILFWWIFLPSRRGSALYRLLALVIAAFSLISGSMGVLGLWDVTKIELVFPFLVPALLLQVPLFWRYWEDVQGGHMAVANQAIETWTVNVA